MGDKNEKNSISIIKYCINRMSKFKTKGGCCTKAVSYTHLDVYKRQHIQLPLQQHLIKNLLKKSLIIISMFQI